MLGKQKERSSRATTQQARHTSNRPRVQRLLEQMSNEGPIHDAKQNLQHDNASADFHSSTWVLVHEVRTASSCSGSSQASLISSAHLLDDELLEPLLEMIGVPLANLHTSSCGEFPHELVVSDSDERDRVNLHWVGLFLRTCKIIHASRTSIMKKIMHFASTLGDARSISRVLVHTRGTTECGMHEVCTWSLLSVTGGMSCPNEHVFLSAHQIFWCRQAAARCLA